ncbi:hypothetical protein [Deinococcus kurensis]|uniref:hypothetical protein n=1 Tax=Deinococcus kurensis TaxID=2662757 RepID=UPI0012D302CD|nr:hypothetical protein [Deinococcus kurensis]
MPPTEEDFTVRATLDELLDCHGAEGLTELFRGQLLAKGKLPVAGVDIYETRVVGLSSQGHVLIRVVYRERT